MTAKTPPIIKWLKEQVILDYSQFTRDWVEGMLALYEEGSLPVDINGAVKYEAETILQIMTPHLLDAGFFKQVLFQAELE